MLKSFIILLAFLCTFLIVRYFYFIPSLIFGQPAPDFKELSTSGKEIMLNDFKNNYLLLSFWGSWCQPCREENKIMVLLYNRYQNTQFKQAKGIKFLSIALESNAENAEFAIKAGGLIWPNHIIQSNMLESPLAKLYGIKQIPSLFLIGPDSRIILANPDIKELDDYLAHNLIKN